MSKKLVAYKHFTQDVLDSLSRSATLTPGLTEQLVTQDPENLEDRLQTLFREDPDVDQAIKKALDIQAPKAPETGAVDNSPKPLVAPYDEEKKPQAAKRYPLGGSSYVLQGDPTQIDYYTSFPFYVCQKGWSTEEGVQYFDQYPHTYDHYTQVLEIENNPIKPSSLYTTYMPWQRVTTAVREYKQITQSVDNKDKDTTWANTKGLFQNKSNQPHWTLFRIKRETDKVLEVVPNHQCEAPSWSVDPEYAEFIINADHDYHFAFKLSLISVAQDDITNLHQGLPSIFANVNRYNVDQSNIRPIGVLDRVASQEVSLYVRLHNAEEDSFYQLKGQDHLSDQIPGFFKLDDISWLPGYDSADPEQRIMTLSGGFRLRALIDDYRAKNYIGQAFHTSTAVFKNIDFILAVSCSETIQGKPVFYRMVKQPVIDGQAHAQDRSNYIDVVDLGPVPFPPWWT